MHIIAYTLHLLHTLMALRVFSDVIGQAVKVKSCVIFEIIGGRGDYGVLASMNGTMRDCMLTCGRLGYELQQCIRRL